MQDGIIVDAKIVRTKLDELPTGTMYVELMCQCEIDGQVSLVPTKLFVTEKSADMAGRVLRKLGFDTTAQDIAALNAGEDSPLAGAVLKISLKETKWGVQGDIPMGGGMNESKMTKMAAMLKGAGKDVDADGNDIPF